MKPKQTHVVMVAFKPDMLHLNILVLNVQRCKLSALDSILNVCRNLKCLNASRNNIKNIVSLPEVNIPSSLEELHLSFN